MDKHLEELIAHYDQAQQNLNSLIETALEYNEPAIADADRELAAAFSAVMSAEIRTQTQFHSRMCFIAEKINNHCDDSQIIDDLTNKLVADSSKMLEISNIDSMVADQNIHSFRDFGGEIARYNIIRQNLVEQSASEKDLEFKSRYLEQAISAIPDAFILYDANGSLIFYNKIHLDFFPHLADLYRSGASREEIWRHHANSIRETDPAVDVEAYVAERKLHSNKLRPDFERQLIDGRWVATRERFLADGGLVTIRTDITWQKQSSVDQVQQGA